MNPVIEEIYRTKHVTDGEGRVHEAFPASLPYEDGMALYEMVRAAKPQRTLEVGMAFGLSTLFICQAHNENGSGSHTAIDPWQEPWWHRVGLFNVERAGYRGFLRFFQAPSYTVLPELLQNGERFDLVFLDGNHRFEFTLLDFFYADRLLRCGGQIVLHDPWLPAIRKVASFLVRNRSAEYELAEEHLGPSPSFLGRLRGLVKTLRSQPLDLCAALLFARYRFPNYCVFTKKAEHTPESFDQTWDFYRSF